jgi:hypothetical protein
MLKPKKPENGSFGFCFYAVESVICENVDLTALIADPSRREFQPAIRAVFFIPMKINTGAA